MLKLGTTKLQTFDDI